MKTKLAGMILILVCGYLSFADYRLSKENKRLTQDNHLYAKEWSRQQRIRAQLLLDELKGWQADELIGSGCAEYYQEALTQNQ